MLETIIKKRKSIRSYNHNEIEIHEILELINIAKYAPSGKNRQPWQIKIIERNDKDNLIKILYKKCKDLNSPGSLNISIKAISECSKVLLIFNPYSYIEEDYSKKKLLMDTQSIGAFIQNFILLATERRISTLWINDVYYAKEEIENIYSSRKLEIIAAVTVGISSRERQFNLRKNLNEILLD